MLTKNTANALTVFKEMEKSVSESKQSTNGKTSFSLILLQAADKGKKE